MTSGRSWTFPDAWVLAALIGAGDRASLTDIIATADGYNHAIVTRAELRGAVRRLRAVGLVRMDPVPRPEPHARQLWERASKRRSLFRAVASLVDVLNRDIPPVTASPWQLSEDAYQAALQAYLRNPPR